MYPRLATKTKQDIIWGVVHGTLTSIERMVKDIQSGRWDDQEIIPAHPDFKSVDGVSYIYEIARQKLNLPVNDEMILSSRNFSSIRRSIESRLEGEWRRMHRMKTPWVLACCQMWDND